MTKREAAGWPLLAAGATLTLVGVQADFLQLGSGPGVSSKQGAVIAVGVAAALPGLFLVRAALPRLTSRLMPPRRLVPFAVALAVYLGAYLNANVITPTGDEPHYMLEARSLVLDRDRNLVNDYTSPERFGPMFGPFVASGHAYSYSDDKNVAYSWHGFGLPLLLAPTAALGPGLWPMRVAMIIMAAATAYLLLSLLRRLAPRAGPLLYAAWAAVAFSLPLVSYSSQVYPELPGAFFVLLCLRLLVEPELGLRGAAVASAAAGFLPWLHFRYGLLSLVLVAALAVRMRPSGAHKGHSARWIWAVAGPFLAGILALAAAHQHWYGSPSPLAGTRLQRPRPEFDLEWAYSHSLGGLIQPAYGWLPFAPIHLLAFVGIVFLAWRHRWALVAALSATVYFFIVGSAKPAGAGFFFPARYQLILIPLAAVPLLLALREVRPLRWAAAALAIPTIALTVAGVAQVDALLPGPKVDTPQLPLAADLAPLWPEMYDRLPNGELSASGYPDWPLALAYVVMVLLAGTVAARLARDRPARAD